jgi:hypothetical protein
MDSVVSRTEVGKVGGSKSLRVQVVFEPEHDALPRASRQILVEPVIFHRKRYVLAAQLGSGVWVGIGMLGGAVLRSV